VETIHALAPGSRFSDESSRSKHAQVLRDGRPSDAKRRRQLMNGLLALTQELEQSTPGGIGERDEYIARNRRRSPLRGTRGGRAASGRWHVGRQK
jgi:hypothetical protein